MRKLSLRKRVSRPVAWQGGNAAPAKRPASSSGSSSEWLARMLIPRFGETRSDLCDTRERNGCGARPETARLAGRVEGDQAALGVTIAFEDLLIAASALHLGFGVATGNVRHFEVVPGLTVVQA